MVGAAQEALVQRLKDRGFFGGSVPEELASLIRHRSVPGRGLGEHPALLATAVGAASRFGPPPLDPAAVPLPELVRLAGAVLLDLVDETTTPVWVSQASRLRRRDVLLRPDVDAAALAWQARVLAGSTRAWGGFARQHNAVDWGAALTEGRRRLRVVVVDSEPALLSLASLDVVRGLSPAIVLRYDPAQRPAIRARLAWAMALHEGRRPGFPAAVRRSTHPDRLARLASLRELIQAQGYAVEGDLSALGRSRPGRGRSRVRGRLEALMRGIERVWVEQF